MNTKRMLPYFEGLSIEEMLEFASNYNNGVSMNALPEPMKEVLKLPRAYIANVIHTMVGKPFSDWVDERIKVRNKKVTDERDLAIKMDPAIAEIFRNSTSVVNTNMLFIIYDTDPLFLICSR